MLARLLADAPAACPLALQTRAMATAVLLLLLLHTLGAAANVTYCWGSGSTGQLGDGKGGGSHTQPLPTAVASGPEFAAVSAGAQHTCGLTAGGQAYCWVSVELMRGMGAACPGRAVCANRCLTLLRCRPVPPAAAPKSNCPLAAAH